MRQGRVFKRIFFADIPNGLFLRDQQAKTSERSENELEYFTLPYAQHNV
jgi:hypothetical protein